MGWLAALLLYGSTRPKPGDDAAGTLLLIVVAVVWVVAGILELIGVHL